MDTHKQFFNRAACAGLFAALVASSPLSADGGPVPIRFGGGLSISVPSGDTAGQGFSFSAFGERELNKNQALRGRFEYHSLGEKTNTVIPRVFGQIVDEWDEKCSVTAAVVMLDFIYSLESRNHGIYLFGGAGFVQGTFKKTFVEGSYSENLDVNGSGFGFSVGGGYQVSSNIGLEVSYTMASGIADTKLLDWYADYGIKSEKLSFNSIQVSGKYRF